MNLLTDFAKDNSPKENKVHGKLIQDWLSSLAAVLKLSIYSIYEIVFVHKFFLYTFFRSSISDIPPPMRLKIGYWNKIQFKIILIIRYFLKDQFWGQRWFKFVHNRILKNLQEQNIDFSTLKMPIKTIPAESLSSDDFWEVYVKGNTPVIIKGSTQDRDAYQSWTLEMFKERFGDFEVNIVNQSDNAQLPDVKTFKEVIDSRQSGKKLYISFCADIFSTNPELLNELDCMKYKEHMGGKNTWFAGAQLFLSANSFTGTPAHCADGDNLFFQIRGRKKWTFVHPDYLWLMYPMLDIHFLFCGSFLKNNYSPEYLKKYAPLQEYCPSYEAILEPGDILLNPAWQWHAIDNLDEENIGVATRWSSIRAKRSNTFFDFIQFFSPYMWRMRFGALKQPDKVGFLEDRTKNVVKKQDSFVLLGNENQTIPWDFDQWPEDYQF